MSMESNGARKMSVGKAEDLAPLPKKENAETRPDPSAKEFVSKIDRLFGYSKKDSKQTSNESPTFKKKD